MPKDFNYDSLYFSLKKLARFLVESKKSREEIEPIVDFIDKWTKYLSWVEMENLHLETQLTYEIKTQRILLNVMETYGIDLSEALSKSQDRMLSDLDLAQNYGNYKIPEKIKPFIAQVSFPKFEYNR